MLNMDISDVSFTSFSTGFSEDAGYVVDPKSDEKRVFIPSPPTEYITKINPRPGVILLTESAITPDNADLDALKAYAKDKKLFLACPNDISIESLKATYEWMMSHAKTLNIDKNDFRIMYQGTKAEADDFVEYAADELDADLADAEEFILA